MSTVDTTPKPYYTAIVHVPARIRLDLVGAIGGLLDTALGGAMLTPGNGHDIGGTVVLRDDQTQEDAIRRLKAARRRIARKPLTPAPEDEPGEEPDPDRPMTLNHVRHYPDGGIEFGIGGPAEVARALAQQLLDAFIPALAESGAPNYLSWDAVHPATGGRYSFIVVKPEGLSPHEARQKTEQECARLRALLAEHGIAIPGSG